MTGSRVSKEDRIRKLVPLFDQGKIYLPDLDDITHSNWEGKIYDPIREFIRDEYLAFPVCVHDDALDALSRMLHKEMQIRAPLFRAVGEGKPTQAKEYDIHGV